MVEHAAVMETPSHVLAAVLGLDPTAQLQTLAVQILARMVELAKTMAHRSRVLVLLCGLELTAEHLARAVQVHAKMVELAVTMVHRSPVLAPEDGKESIAQQIHALPIRVFTVENVPSLVRPLRVLAYQDGPELTVAQRSMFVSRAIHARMVERA